MKHAILILAHEAPESLLRLVARLQHERISIFIHLDRKSADIFDWQYLENKGANLISTRKVNWGGMSICLAALDLLKLARKQQSFQTYSLISGRDYPVKHINQIVLDLDQTDSNLIDFWHDERPNWHKRFERYYFQDFRLRRLLNAAALRMAHILPKRKVPQGISIYFGWTWWTLQNNGVEAILRFCDERPDVMRWYEYMRIPDESFFQTALNNSDISPNLSRAIRRYFIFIKGSSHPKIINHNDVDDALSGQYWFARKVDHVERNDVLDKIDQLLGIT